jgi:hypothetical protein
MRITKRQLRQIIREEVNRARRGSRRRRLRETFNYGEPINFVVPVDIAASFPEYRGGGTLTPGDLEEYGQSDWPGQGPYTQLSVPEGDAKRVFDELVRMGLSEEAQWDYNRAHGL